MEIIGIIIAAVIALIAGVIVGNLISKKILNQTAQSAAQKAENILEKAKNDANAIVKEAKLEAKDGKYGYVNKEGIVVVNYVYDDATEQNKYGFAAVKKDGKWGTINSEGEEIVSPSLELKNNPIIDFIGTWHLAEDLNSNYYTKK